MTLDAGGNRYVHHLQAIRAIQAHLMSAAKEAQVWPLQAWVLRGVLDCGMQTCF